MTTEEKLEDTTLTPKILDILSYQHAITSQGENYTGEKDWALNKLKSLIAESIHQALAEERERVVGIKHKLWTAKSYYSTVGGDERNIGRNLMADDILAFLDKPLTDKE